MGLWYATSNSSVKHSLAFLWILREVLQGQAYSNPSMFPVITMVKLFVNSNDLVSVCGLNHKNTLFQLLHLLLNRFHLKREPFSCECLVQKILLAYKNIACVGKRYDKSMRILLCSLVSFLFFRNFSGNHRTSYSSARGPNDESTSFASLNIASMATWMERPVCWLSLTEFVDPLIHNIFYRVQETFPYSCSNVAVVPYIVQEIVLSGKKAENSGLFLQSIRWLSLV